MKVDILQINNKVKVSDISEINPSESLEEKRYPAENDLHKKSGRINKREAKRGLSHYLENRKYFILLFSFIYMMGLIIGVMMIKRSGTADIAVLYNKITDFYIPVEIPQIMTRLFYYFLLCASVMFFIYLAGLTIFSSVISSLLCIAIGYINGFVAGILILGSGSAFGMYSCAVYIISEIILMIFYILASGESMSFSVFLFKSEDNFKSNMSFKNLSMYSSRFFIFLILIMVFKSLQTFLIPLFYSVYF